MIQLRNITKLYGDKTVLSGLNLTIERGGDYCITGASGVGKTTLLHILMGLLTPDSGEIRGIAEHKIAPVFQEDRLCRNLSAGRNIRLAAQRRLTTAEINETLDSLRLEGCIHRPVRELSGGMLRRVSLARAILSEGDLWLFDEPFSSLDPDTKQEVMDTLRNRRGKRTMVWVTHDLSDAQYMNSSIIRL